MGKKPRVWDGHGTKEDLKSLERTTDKPSGDMQDNFSPDIEVPLIFLQIINTQI